MLSWRHSIGHRSPFGTRQGGSKSVPYVCCYASPPRTKIYAPFEGYEVLGAVTPKEVISAVKRFSPQVILISAYINGDNGIGNIIREIKDIDRYCNILVFSRDEEPEIIKELWKAGAFFFLREGDNISNIIPEIERAYDEYFTKIELKRYRNFIFVLMTFSEQFDDI
jgi:hypothetical protein